MPCPVDASRPEAPSAGSPPQPTRHTHDGGDHCPGTTRPFQAKDGKIARVRLAGAPLTVAQVRGIGDLATRLGDGNVWFTARANVQVRGLAEGDVRAFADGLAALGLFPAPTHDRARNVVVAPLAGPDVLGLAAAFDAALCSRPVLAGLSGRFLVGIDDGSGELLALPLDLSCQVVDGRVRVALGSDPRAYEAGAIGDPAVPEILAGLCEIFLSLAADEEVWNVDDLSAVGTDELHAQVEDVLAPAAALRVVRRQPRLAGVVDGRWLTATAPLASIPVAGWRALADVAEALGSDVRVTPWHAMVLELPAGADDGDVRAHLARLAATGWVVDGTSPWLHVHGCVGEDHCARSLSDVQTHARDIVAAGPDLRSPVMVVGCERRCGHPAVDHFAIVATGPDSYEISENDGSHGPRPAPFATTDARGVTGVVAGRTAHPTDEGRA